ncbi:MAG: hypothetical protein ACJAXY_000205 [Nonlabens sp.]|jgi:hypothetical protein
MIPVFGIKMSVTHKLRSYAYRSESNNQVPLDGFFFIRNKKYPLK